MENKKVEIILSTYNGEKYIEEQIASLLEQSYTNTKIIIRDDGSTDGTLKKLQKYENNKKVEIYKGKNKGVTTSFLELLSLTSEDVDYIAFCDQDDVWKSDKILRAIKACEKENQSQSLIYCSRMILVDENLKELKNSEIPRKPLKLENALVENVITGCTCVINKNFKQKLQLTDTRNMIMHDWWFYLIGTTFGKIIFDSEPTIFYRQHSNNVAGISTTFQDKWRRRFKKKSSQKKWQNQAEAFLNLYEKELSYNEKKTIEEFIKQPKTFFLRLIYAIKSPLYRQSKIDNIVLRILFLFKV